MAKHFCKPIFDEKKQLNIFANPFSMRKNGKTFLQTHFR